MIDNFAPQPYPLEASTDGATWRLVIGWQRASGTGELTPVFASDDLGSPRYRLAAPPTSTLRASPSAVSSRTVEAVRTEARAVAPRRRPDPA